MRPRKNGPCHGLLLEYAANRKRKALAVLHFAKAGADMGHYGRLCQEMNDSNAELANDAFRLAISEGADAGG